MSLLLLVCVMATVLAGCLAVLAGVLWAKQSMDAQFRELDDWTNSLMRWSEDA